MTRGTQEAVKQNIKIPKIYTPTRQKEIILSGKLHHAEDLMHEVGRFTLNKEIHPYLRSLAFRSSCSPGPVVAWRAQSRAIS